MDNRSLKSRLGLKLLGPLLLIAVISLLVAVVIVVVSYNNQGSFTEQLLLQGVVLFVFLLGLIIPLAWFYLSKKVIHPLILLKDGATRLAQGDEHPIELKTNDELEELAQAFNILTANVLASQKAMADMTIENANLFQGVQHRITQLRLFSQISAHISAILNPAEIFGQVVNLITNAFKYYHIQIYQVDEYDPTRLISISSAGTAQTSPQAMMTKNHLPINDESIAGWVARHHKLLCVNDVRQDARYHPQPDLPDTLAEIALPIRAGKTIFGVLDIQHHELNAFSEEDTYNLQALADQLAVATQNASLFNEALQRERLSSALSKAGLTLNKTLDPQQIANTICQEALIAFQVDSAFLWLVEDDHIYGAAGSGRHKDEFIGQVIPLSKVEVLGARIVQSRRAEFIKEADFRQGKVSQELVKKFEVRSLLGAPLIIGERTLGALMLIDCQNPDRFDFQDQISATLLANQAAVALQNIRLLSDTQAQADHMRRLYELGISVSQEYDLKQILSSVIQEALTLTGAQAGAIWLWDEETEAYMVENTARSPEYTQPLYLASIKPDALIAQVLHAGEAFMINDLTGDAPNIAGTSPRSTPRRGVKGESLAEAGIGEEPVRVACIGAPIKVGEQTIGAMLVYCLEGRTFYEQDLNLLQFLATQTSATIRNVQLVSRLNRLTEELEQRVEERTKALAETLQELRQERDRVDTLYHIGRQLSASLDLDRVLNEALYLISHTIPITQGAILLLTPGEDRLVYRAALGRRRPLPRGGKETRYKIGVGLAGHILETRQPQIVHNLLDNELWLPDDKELVHRSVLAVPLITAYEALGVLMLFHTQPNHFTEDHLSLVVAASPMIATAISNADLYTLITQQSERVGILLRSVQAEAIKNEAIIEGIADGVLVIDSDYSIQLVNPATARILDIDKEALHNQKLEFILTQMTSPVDQQIAQKLYQIVTTQHGHLREQGETLIDRITVEGRVIVISLTPISLRANTRIPSSTLVVLRDISREAELERIKNEFISTVSHELRTPMTSIKGYVDLLATDKAGPVTDMQRRFLQIIKSNADRLTALVNDILDISRLDAGRVKLEPQLIDLVALIQHVTTNFKHQLEEKKLSLTLNMPNDPPPAYADPDRVTQVLINLFSNATKYTRPNDSITISLKTLDHYLQVSVSDTGLGISVEDQKRVFDRFFRAERDANSLVDGTGLGLPIAKMLVEMIGGEIWVESELGQGSTFTFTLPLEAEAARQKHQEDLEPGQRCILVVDDNEDILALLKQQLEEAGYQVVTVAKSDQVLKQAKKYHPSLITLDIILDHKDGFEILEQLKSDPEIKDTPVVIASVLTNIRNKSLALGAADYIVKPFDQEQVLQTIQRLVETVETHQAGLKFKKVLVVDDDKDIVIWLKEALRHSGFEVSGAYNGQEALILVREKQPDLILLDLKMPDMDGFAVIEKLRSEETTANIPIIVITGSSIDKRRDQIKVLGLETSHLITKPFTFDELVSEIKRLEEQSSIA